VPFLKVKSLDAIADLSMVLKQNGQTIEIKHTDEMWHLQSMAEKHFYKNSLGTLDPCRRSLTVKYSEVL
jgi:hypothetical protein